MLYEEVPVVELLMSVPGVFANFGKRLSKTPFALGPSLTDVLASLRLGASLESTSIRAMPFHKTQQGRVCSVQGQMVEQQWLRASRVVVGAH